MYSGISEWFQEFFNGILLNFDLERIIRLLLNDVTLFFWGIVLILLGPLYWDYCVWLIHNSKLKKKKNQAFLLLFNWFISCWIQSLGEIFLLL